MKIPCYSCQARAMKFASWHFLNDGNTLILLWICLGLIAVLVIIEGPRAIVWANPELNVGNYLKSSKMD